MAVITDTCLVVASFPRPTRPTRIVNHKHVSGVSRDGEKVTVHCTADSNITLFLSKADMFVVYMADLQDRAVGRNLHFAAKDASSPTLPSSASPPSSQHKLTAAALALKLADDAMHPLDEASLGVLRFGTSSKRETKPCREVEEGSDASSVQTLEHQVEDDLDELVPPDLPQVVVDATSIHRRLYYFFLQYDRAKLPFIEKMVAQHRSRETQLMRDLEAQYGPEPNKTRWETRDQLAHQRSLKFQLTAQLRRARDELLVLEREECAVRAALDGVVKKKNEFLLEERRKQFEGNAPSSRSAPPSKPLLHLIKVLRVVEQSSSFSRPVERSFYFLLPFMFFDFVKEQCTKVAGAATPPLVTVVNETTDKQFAVNWSFLGGWAVDFGAHCVSFQDRESQQWRFLPGEKFWQLY